MSSEKGRSRLLELLAERSYRYSDIPEFQLSSGGKSQYYIDCKQTTLFHEARPLIGECFSALMPSNISAVGGLTMGADPIAFATADYCTAHQSHNMDVFTVRKEPKKHGTKKWIEGPVQEHEQVLVVDDVVTTGASTIIAIERCSEANLHVAAVMVLVDREEESGMEKIRKAAGNVPIIALFTRNEIHAAWKERQSLLSEQG